MMKRQRADANQEPTTPNQIAPGRSIARGGPAAHHRGMAKESAGLLLYRQHRGEAEVFLVHPGGPFWARKDAGAWTIPKGEPAAGEDPLGTARRELTEETGLSLDGPFIPLEPVRQKAGKLVRAWAVEADCDPADIASNTFTLEWPPRSGRTIEVPEVDRAEWFDLATARRKINPAQAAFLDELERRLGGEVND